MFNDQKFRVKFCSADPDMIYHWNKEFYSITYSSNVRIIQGDMFTQEADAIVSPGNSFGLMDAGIDALICVYFGYKIQKKLQKIIKTDHCGELLVGEAVIIETGNEKNPYFISAPTMRVPMRLIESINPYLAVRAVFLSILKHNSEIKNRERKISSVIIPGMGISTGKMPCEVVAKQMKEAYDSIILGKKSFPNDWIEARARHKLLVETKEVSEARSLSESRKDHGVFE